jgi:hypothetical protein
LESPFYTYLVKFRPFVVFQSLLSDGSDELADISSDDGNFFGEEPIQNNFLQLLLNGLF